MSDVQNVTKAADEVFCSSCGAIIKMQAEICPKCGVRQKSAARSSNWFTLFLLSFIVGCFGVDRFYVGKVGTGILKMILGCIAMILSIAVLRVVAELEAKGFDFTDETNMGVVIALALTRIPLILMGIWWLIDFVMVCLGKFTDSKGNAITRGN